MSVLFRILSALLFISDVTKSVKDTTASILTHADKIANLGLFGAGGAVLQLMQGIFSRLENLEALKTFNVDFGSKYMTPFGTTLYWNEIQKQIYAANRQLGISGNLSKELEKNIIAAGTSSIELGFSEKEIVETYEKFIDRYERNVLLSDDDLKKLSKISYAFGESYSEIFALSKLYGGSIKQTYESLNNINKQADKFGLNSKKVFSDIQQNIKLIDKFTFKNGLDGLNQMVIKSNQLGSNLQSIESFANKVMNPEGALETAASLQMLGGEFANFGDFFSLIYDANYDLESLNKKMLKAVKGMGSINKETGFVDISGLEMNQIRAFAQLVDRSTEDVSRLVRVSKKEGVISNLISPNVKAQLDDFEGTISKIAGMAEFKGGSPKITIGNTQKLISELTLEDIKSLSQVNESKGEDSISNLISESKTSLEYFDILGERVKRITNDFEILGAESQVLTKILAAGDKSLSDGTLEKTTKAIKAAKIGGAESVERIVTPFVSDDPSTMMENFWDNLKMNNKINAEVLNSFKEILGPDSRTAQFLDVLIKFETGFMESIEEFGRAVKTSDPRLIPKPFSTEWWRQFWVESPFKTIENIILYDSKNSFPDKSETLSLFEKNEKARKKLEEQVLSMSENEFSVKVANESWIIEFYWNGKVYNVFNLFEDPNFQKLLKKDIGESNAKMLIDKFSYSNKYLMPEYEDAWNF